MMNTRILVNDDDQVSSQLFAEVLEEEGFLVDQTHSGEEAFAQLQRHPYDLLLTDIRLPGISGLELTRKIRAFAPDLPIVVMTAFGSMETAIEAIREGAFDYASKPMNLGELKETVTRALSLRAPFSRTVEPQNEEREGEARQTIIGKSAAMVEVYKTIARVAPTRSTVLVLGESGTGKELVARAIHQHSARANGPFVALDCGTLAENLLESELFGHVRGAFTGAVADKKGVFEAAHGGTCFLDEIGDISPALQARLLRVLQENEIRRVGSQRVTKIDVRVVAATNKDLAALVQRGVFREDLYYRLHVLTIALPPLRERLEDLRELALAFLHRYGREHGKSLTAIAEETLALLQAYTWPGNIRELENVMSRAVVLSRQPILLPEDLPDSLRYGRDAQPTSVSGAAPAKEHPLACAELLPLEEVKKRYILYALEQLQGNMSRTAEILQIDRRSLYRMLKRFAISLPREKR